MLRGLDGHGHFKTISIFLKRRTPYKKKHMKNYPILKLKYLDFSVLNVTRCQSLQTDLMVNLLTTQPP